MKHYEGEKWEFDDQKLTPIRAIRKMCLQCMAGDIEGVKECPDFDCPLHQYRLGHNPKKKGQGPKRPAFSRKRKEKIKEIMF